MRKRFDMLPEAASTAPAGESFLAGASGSESSGRSVQPVAGDSGFQVLVSSLMQRYGWEKRLTIRYLRSREHAVKTDVVPLLEQHRDLLTELHRGDADNGQPPDYDPVFLFALMFYQARAGISENELADQGRRDLYLQAAFDLKSFGPNKMPRQDTLFLFRRKMMGERRAATLLRQLRDVWVRKFGPSNHNLGCDITHIDIFMAMYFLGPLFVRLVRSCLREAIIENPRLFRLLPAEFLLTYGFTMKGKNVLRIVRMKMPLPDEDTIFNHVSYLIWFAGDRPEFRELESYRELETAFLEHLEILKGQITVWGVKIHRAVIKR